MRKLVLTALIVLMAYPAYSGIVDNRLFDNIALHLESIRGTAAGTKSSLNNLKTQIEGLVLNYPSSIPDNEKTKLTNVGNDINALITACDDLIDQIDLDFPIVKE